MGPHKSGVEQLPPPPPVRVESVSGSSTTSTVLHRYALLLANMFAVEIDSFTYFRDEYGVSVSYIYRT